MWPYHTQFVITHIVLQFLTWKSSGEGKTVLFMVQCQNKNSNVISGLQYSAFNDFMGPFGKLTAIDGLLNLTLSAWILYMYTNGTTTYYSIANTTYCIVPWYHGREHEQERCKTLQKSDMISKSNRLFISPSAVYSPWHANVWGVLCAWPGSRSLAIHRDP